jgi:signal transduction histidine kinase
MIGGAVAVRLARSAVVLDWLPVLLVPPVMIIDAALSVQGKPLGVVNVLCTFAGCLPLALRRHVSFPVLSGPVVGGVVLILWQLHPANTVVLMPMVVLFELSLSGDRRRSLWMSLAIVPCVFVSVIPFASGFSHVASIVIRNTALVLVAIAAGDVIRSRRVSEQRLVEAAEQETLRRVGEERLRIAREIHDVVAHAMTAINVQAGVAAHLLERDPGQAYDALRNIKQTSGDALTDLRTTLAVLRDPSQTAPLGPPAGLVDIAGLTGGLRSAGVAVQLDVDTAADIPAVVQSTGYRIVQEALTNVARHAEASTARVCVKRVPGAVTIEVVDDGSGALAAPAGSASGSASGDGAGGGAGGGAGNGLRGMRERAAAIGGTLEAAPVATGGWRVQARLPVGSANGAATPA